MRLISYIGLVLILCKIMWLEHNPTPLLIYPFYADKRKEQYPSLKDYFLDIGLFANTAKEGTFAIQDTAYKIIASKGRSSDLLPWSLNKEVDFNIYDNHNRRLYQNLTLGDTVLGR